MPTNKVIPMDQIDEPEIAMRIDITDSSLRELADDIVAHGLINPITVVMVKGRYQIAAGHCRFLAHKLLAKTEIQCRDFTDDGVDIEALKFAENDKRMQVGEGATALFLHDLYVKKNYNIEQLMAVSGKSEYWINIAFQLVEGDQDIFKALCDKQIKKGAAILLNQFSEKSRPFMLQQVIQYKYPNAHIENWLRLESVGTQEDVPAPAPALPNVLPMPVPGISVNTCWYCQSDHSPWNLEHKPMHASCREMIQKALEAVGKD